MPLLAALVLAIALFLLPVSAPNARAATCSIVSIEDPQARLDFMEPHWRGLTLILVGVVTAETEVEVVQDRHNPMHVTFVPVRASSPNPELSGALFLSKVRSEAVLLGDPPAEELELPWLNSLSGGCIGGPRLREGERVLLFLRWTPTVTTPAGPTEHIWQMSLVGGKAILRPDGTAMLEELWTPDPESVGSSEALIRRVAAAVGAGPEATQDAIAASTASVELPAQAGVSPWVLVLAVLPLLAGVVVLMHRRSAAETSGRSGPRER